MDEDDNDMEEDDANIANDRLNMSDLVCTEHVWSCSQGDNFVTDNSSQNKKHIYMGLDYCGPKFESKLNFVPEIIGLVRNVKCF